MHTKNTTCFMPDITHIEPNQSHVSQLFRIGILEEYMSMYTDALTKILLFAKIIKLTVYYISYIHLGQFPPQPYAAGQKGP